MKIDVVGNDFRFAQMFAIDHQIVGDNIERRDATNILPAGHIGRLFDGRRHNIHRLEPSNEFAFQLTDITVTPLDLACHLIRFDIGLDRIFRT